MAQFTVDQVTDRLYICNFEAANCSQLMEDYGITHILCAAAELPTPFPSKFKYLKIEVDDAITENIRRYFEPCIEFIVEALKTSGSKVMVHCKQGVSRSPTVVMAYLMKAKKYSANKAFDFLKLKRPEISPNPGFVQQLQSYDKELREIARKDPNAMQGCACALL
jgi:protein-tyrosine phosphatase